MIPAKIITEHVYPPIPLRCRDWSAHFEGDDPETRLTGWGATKEAAIQDLRDQAEAEESDREEERVNNGQFGVGA